MDNFSIEVVVFGVLILVIVLDLLIKGRKKKQDIQDESNLIKGKETTDEKKSSFIKGVLNYLIERPRNITLYLILVFAFKILVTFSFFDAYSYRYGKNSRLIIEKTKPRPPSRRDLVNSPLDYTPPPTTLFDFKEHIRLVMVYKQIAFIYSFLLITFLVWQLNPYIKKR